MKLYFKDNLMSRPPAFLLLLVWLLIVWGCAGTQLKNNESESYYPKASLNADKLITLQSNKEKTSFFVDGNFVVKGKRVQIMVSNQPHTVLAQPEGYISKEEYIQPPYDTRYTVGFYYLIEDQNYEKDLPAKVKHKIGEYNIHDIPDFKASPRLNDIAVVIGIENYRGLPKSDYSKSDAAIMKDYLNALGFQERNIEFITDQDATRSAIEKAIEAWLPNRMKKDSRVLVYYSGHGAPEPNTGDAYIVPFDGDPNYLSVTGYSLMRLYDKLGKLQAGEVIVLLDSCFSGAGGRSVLAKGARPLVMMKEGTVLSQNIAVLSATQGSQISTSSPEKGHGIFTYYFLKAIKEGKKDIAEIYSYIKPLVEDEAKQLNVQQSPDINPDPEKLKGRFSLRN